MARACTHCGRGEQAGQACERDGRWYCCHGCLVLAAILAGEAVDTPAAAPDPLVGGWEQAGEIELTVDGMWCASCETAIEAVLMRQEGVESARVSFAASTAAVRWDPAKADLARVLQAVTRLGYALRPIGNLAQGEASTQALRGLQIRLAVAAFFGNTAMMTAWSLYAGDLQGMDPVTGWWLAALSGLAALPVVFFAGWPFLVAGWRTLLAGVPGMDFLIAAGSVAAFVQSTWHLLVRWDHHVYFDTAAMLVTFLLAGRLIEASARHKGMASIRTLLSLAPERATLVKADGGEQDVAVAEISVDSLVRIRPGERVAIDGCVEQGRSTCDKSLLTGESDWLPIGPGDPVSAGTLNGDGALLVRVTHAAGERLLDQIGHAMRRLLIHRSPADLIVARLLRWFAPAVTLVALLSGLVFGWLAGDAGVGVIRAVTVLVIACPCALGLAGPMAVLVAAGSAARRGILFRDSESIERLATATMVALDKTGTLTLGQPRVLGVVAASGERADTVLAAAAIAETGSEHPLAGAILDAAGGPRPSAGDIQAVPGAGVLWQAPGEAAILVGSAAFMQTHGVTAGDVAAEGATLVHVARGGRWLGAIRLGDSLRPETPAVIGALRQTGLPVAMLTGDNAWAAESVAEAAGMALPAVHAGMSPLDKGDWIQAAERDGVRVAFVGDGLNDGPALAGASVAVSLAGATDVAVSAAHVVLNVEGIARLPEAVDLARRTRRVMRQNLAWAIVYNLVAVPLAIAGIATPLMAAAAMVFSSLSVVANSLRLSDAASRPGGRRGGQPGQKGPDRRQPVPAGAHEVVVGSR